MQARTNTCVHIHLRLTIGWLVCFVMQNLKTIPLKGEAKTLAFGARLAPFLRAGDVVALRGDLGAGKTCLSRGIITALTDANEVPSPTYTLVQMYESSSFNIWHFDLYRLENADDVWELGIEEALEGGVCLIEWPERIENLLSGAELEVQIRFDGGARTLHIAGSKNWEERLAKL